MWQSHLRYHPRLGYTYTPNFRGRRPHENGGFLLRANAAGFRSDREFDPEPSGGYRVFLFGDSQTAGFGVANAQRFSDRLEALVPGLEIYNFAVSGTGTDQQYLNYLEHRQINHDLVIIGLYVEDVQRVNSAFQRYNDADGRAVYYAKPYFRNDQGRLDLHGVPVPKHPLRQDDMPKTTQTGAFRDTIKTKLAHSTTAQMIARSLRLPELMRALQARHGPAGYSDREPAWQLLELILQTWIANSAAPVLLLPIPSRDLVSSTSVMDNYSMRYRDFSTKSGCHIHDLLSQFRVYSEIDRRNLYFRNDVHLSAAGHAAIAASLAPELTKLVAGRELQNRLTCV